MSTDEIPEISTVRILTGSVVEEKAMCRCSYSSEMSRARHGQLIQQAEHARLAEEARAARKQVARAEKQAASTEKQRTPVWGRLAGRLRPAL